MKLDAREIRDVVLKDNIISYYHSRYTIFIAKSTPDFYEWTDKLLDHYLHLKKRQKESDYVCKALALKWSLEDMIGSWNQTSKIKGGDYEY